MKTIHLKTACCKRWTISFFLIPKLDCTYYTFSIAATDTQKIQYRSQQIYSTEAAAHLAAYFFCLRSALDQEPSPALLVDRNTGNIMVVNLAGLELLAIDPVGLNIKDFSVSWKNQRWSLSHLEPCHQVILLRDADGKLLRCKVTTEVEPYYCKWITFRLKLLNDGFVTIRQVDE
jgi:hypothetical protein